MKSAPFKAFAAVLLLAALPPSAPAQGTAPAPSTAVSAPAAAGASAATAVVERFHTLLVETMAQGPKLGCQGRAAKLAPAVAATYDLDFIAERALRKHWKALTAPQRAAFAQTLQTSVVDTYATEFATPGAVSFTTIGTETLPSGDALVHTRLLPAKGRPVTLDYVLKTRGGQPRVVNVLAEGVSDLALRSSQYDTLMKTQGFDALQARLATQNRELLARCQ